MLFSTGLSPAMQHTKRILGTAGLFLFGTVLLYLCRLGTMASAFTAKQTCSAIFLQERSLSDIQSSELSAFPFSLFTNEVNLTDSSVISSIGGLFASTAVFRAGAGVTLVNRRDIKKLKNDTWMPLFEKPDVSKLYWPKGDLLTDTVPSGIDTTLLNNTIVKQFNENSTRALLVIYNQQLVAERYAQGYDVATRMPSWSMAKSITAALTAVLVQQGSLSLTDPAPIAEWKNTTKSSITLTHLLQQTSGLDYREKYTGISTATVMLFESKDVYRYGISLPLRHSPGTAFNYSSANSNIISGIVRNSMSDRQYRTFPYKSLFQKIGMYSAVLEPDFSGTYVGSSFCYASARDYARLALLYYNNGNWFGDQLFPENWISLATKAPEVNTMQDYGFHVWLNGTKKGSSKRKYPSAPQDLYGFSGYAGQEVFIIPSKKTIIVRLGIANTDDDLLIGNVLAALP